jgi:hypothetical protein
MSSVAGGLLLEAEADLVLAEARGEDPSTTVSSRKDPPTRVKGGVAAPECAAKLARLPLAALAGGTGGG